MSATLAGVGAHAAVAAGGQRGFVDVGDEGAGAASDEAVGDDPADAAGARGDGDAQPGEVERQWRVGALDHWISSVYRSVSRNSMRRLRA